MILYCTDSFIHYSIGDPNGVYCCDRYDNLERCIPDAFTHLLEEIHHTEMELSHLPQKWKVLWDKLELPTTDSLTVSVLHLLHPRVNSKTIDKTPIPTVLLSCPPTWHLELLLIFPSTLLFPYPFSHSLTTLRNLTDLSSTLPFLLSTILPTNKPPHILFMLSWANLLPSS